MILPNAECHAIPLYEQLPSHEAANQDAGVTEGGAHSRIFTPTANVCQYHCQTITSLRDRRDAHRCRHDDQNMLFCK